MAKPSMIKIMISSRCSDPFPMTRANSRSLTEIRKTLKQSIESAKLFDDAIYEVWINEEQIGDSTKAAWEHCMEQAADCDIFLALFNGNAGWEDTAGAVGICHAELERAHSVAPGKVFILNILENAKNKDAWRDIDIRFQRYVESLKRLEMRGVSSEATLVHAIHRTLSQATVKLVQRGVQGASLGTNHVGPALNWSRLNYSERAARMRKAILAALDQGGPKGKALNDGVVRKIDGKHILFMAGAIPDAMSIPAAREVVGQPHLRDYRLCDSLRKLHGGPVHIVACHKGNTESQARTMLGFPDATVVSAPFGIYVVDPVQGIQLALIAQCRDDTSTRIGVGRFLEWLDAAEQGSDLVRYATKRKSVVQALASEL
jgi:hypothetical protein